MMDDTSDSFINYLKQIESTLQTPSDQPKLYKSIVNAPFEDKLQATHLDLGVVVLLLVNNETQTIDRIALSNTYSAEGAVRMSAKPFNQIKIPVNHPKNIIAKAIATGKMQHTADWTYLFVPSLTSREAHFNQAGAGIDCSVVYPLQAGDGGALIFSFYQPLANIGPTHHEFMKKYAEIVDTQLTKITAQ